MLQVEDADLFPAIAKSKRFGDFGEYYSYSHVYHSNLYDEDLMVCFKTPLNPQANPQNYYS